MGKVNLLLFTGVNRAYDNCNASPRGPSSLVFLSPSPPTYPRLISEEAQSSTRYRLHRAARSHRAKTPAILATQQEPYQCSLRLRVIPPRLSVPCVHLTILGNCPPLRQILLLLSRISSARCASLLRAACADTHSSANARPKALPRRIRPQDPFRRSQQNNITARIPYVGPPLATVSMRVEQQC